MLRSLLYICHRLSAETDHAENRLIAIHELTKPIERKIEQWTKDTQSSASTTDM